MSDAARDLEPIESPCIGVCRLDENGACLGCFRTAEEIGGWLAMDADQRRAVIEELPARADRLFDD